VLTGCSSLSPEVKSQIKEGMKKTEIGKLVGEALARKASSSGISQVVFDRSFYLYHGRIKTLAEGAREGGLKF
jgi:large subunit ribosomal protein L18